MPSIRSAVLAVAAALFAVGAQADYVIVPSSVPLSTRQAWCSDELSTCPIICQQVPPGTTRVNSCDPTTLTYGCVCGNNQQPNVTQYTLTLPYFVCQEWGTQCVQACGSDNTCASNCLQDHPCGALSPVRANSTSSSTMAATATGSSTSSGGLYTGLAGTTSSPSGKSLAASSVEVGQLTGLLLAVGSLFAGFAIML